MDIQTVKDILMITDSKYDVYLDTVVPIFEEKIKEWTNNRFKDSEGNEVLPINLQHTVAKWVQHDMNVKAGIKSRSMGEVSYTFDTDVPDFVKRDIAPYRRLRF